MKGDEINKMAIVLAVFVLILCESDRYPVLGGAKDFEIKTIDPFVALIPVVVWLIVTGKISRQSVRNTLKEEGIQPGPNCTSDSWENFIERHKETLWACDYFRVKTVAARGFRDLCLLAWLLRAVHPDDLI